MGLRKERSRPFPTTNITITLIFHYYAGFVLPNRRFLFLLLIYSSIALAAAFAGAHRFDDVRRGDDIAAGVDAGKGSGTGFRVGFDRASLPIFKPGVVLAISGWG